MRLKSKISFLILYLLFIVTVFSDPLEVISVSPMPNSEYVNLNSNIEAVFNNEVFPADISKFTFTVNDGHTDIEGEIKYFRLLKKAIFIPKEKLVSGRRYKVTIWAGIRDMQSQRLPSSVVWIFSTGKSEDRTRPFLVASDPPDGSYDIPLRPELTLTFSEALIDDSFNHFSLSDENNDKVSINVFKGNRNNQVEIVPETELIPETKYILKADRNIEDLSGNQTGIDYSLTFHTLDNIKPEIIKVYPEHEQRKVSVTQNFCIYVNDDMKEESLVRDNFRLLLDGEEEEILVKYHNKEKMIELIPQNTLKDSSFYEVKVLEGVYDKGGNLLEPATFEFKTEDNTRPALVDYRPEDGEENVSVESLILLKFSEIIDKDTLDKGVVISDGNEIIPFTSEINKYGINVQIDPEYLNKKKKYRVTVRDTIKDLEGNPLDDIYQFGFSTVLFDTDEINTKLEKYSEFDEKQALEKIQDMIGMPYYEKFVPAEQVAANEVRDRIPPRVIDHFPNSDMKDVPVNSRITVIFSEDIQAHTLEKGISISTRKYSVPFKVKYDRKFKKAEIIPELMEPGLEHRVILKDSIRDNGENGLISLQFRFTTTENVEEGLIIAAMPEKKKVNIPEELLEEEVVEFKENTLEELREKKEDAEKIEKGETDPYKERERWATGIVLDLREKFAKRYAIVTANPKVKPSRYELALIIRSIINKVNDDKMRRLFRTPHGIKDLIVLFQASVEYSTELEILGVDLKSFEEKLKNSRIPVAEIRDDLNKGLIKKVD
ncbi:MAG: Ig-like domain-containing protein [Candidatus Muiribacteriaceae bacterium]